MKPVIRPASRSDVAAIARIVADHARRGHLLPRSEADIGASLHAWLVAADGDQVLGCGSLVMYSPTLVELRSLAVDDRAQGRGLGGELTRALIEEARHRGAQRLFALTRIVPFFEHAGFTATEKAAFPEKVWRDCVQCPLLDRCDETAVVLDLRARPRIPIPLEQSPVEEKPYA